MSSDTHFMLDTFKKYGIKFVKALIGVPFGILALSLQAILKFLVVSLVALLLSISLIFILPILAARMTSTALGAISIGALSFIISGLAVSLAAAVGAVFWTVISFNNLLESMWTGLTIGLKGPRSVWNALKRNNSVITEPVIRTQTTYLRLMEHLTEYISMRRASEHSSATAEPIYKAQEVKRKKNPSFILLTNEELDKAGTIPKLNNQLERYHELINKLKTLDAAIKARGTNKSAPLDVETDIIPHMDMSHPILIYKEVEIEKDSWVTQPGTTYIEDMSSWKTVLGAREKPVHPLTREDITNPPSFHHTIPHIEKDLIGATTRFRWHSYTGYCQELHEITNYIRQACISKPSSEPAPSKSTSTIIKDGGSHLFHSPVQTEKAPAEMTTLSNNL